MQINHADTLAYTGQLCAISEGVQGIHETTRLMAQIVAGYQFDPNIRAQAISIVQLAPPKDQPAELRALFDFVKDSVRYVGDVAGTETIQTPDITLALKAGDCDDKSVLLATLMRAIGYPAVFIVTGYSAPNVYEHVYVGWPQADGSYVALDPSEPQPFGWEASGAVASYIEKIPG